MNNLKDSTNEELAIMFQDSKSDEIFEEIYNRFEKMINKFIYKHRKYGFIEDDELISACRFGLYDGVMKYNKDKRVALSTVVYRYIQSKINHSYDYWKSNGREKLKQTSVYLDYPIETDRGIVPLVEVVNHENSEDTYFENEFIHMKDAIQYAMSKLIDVQFKEYIIPMLIGDYKQQEIADKFNVKHGNVQYQIKKFKKYILMYTNGNKELMNI